MEILLTGGNGFLGRHLVPALQDRGDRVRVLALRAEDTFWLEERGVAVYRGDVRDPETLIAPMKGVDHVVHAAALQNVWRPYKEYHAVNVAGTANVCRAALEAGVARLVHVSSAIVYGMGLKRPADESFPMRPFPEPYPITKVEGDQVVQTMIREHGLRAVIIRPSQIFGPGDHLHFGMMAGRLRQGKGIIVGSGRNVMPFVYVSDVVAGLLLALDRPAAVGQIFNIANDNHMTQVQFLSTIAQEVGASSPRVHLPYHALFAVGQVAETLVSLTGSTRRPPITRLGVAFFGTSNRYAIDKARRMLGYSPQVPLDEGIRLASTWYRRQNSIVEAAPTATGAAAKAQ